MRRRVSKTFLAPVFAVGAVLLAAAAHAPPAAVVADLKIASAGSAPAVAATTAGTVAPVILTNSPHAEPELRLISVIETFRRGEIDSALAEAEGLIDSNPNFKLAHLLYGDLLASRTGAPMSFQSTSIPSKSVDPLMAEARQRWKHYRTSKRVNHAPESIVKMSASQKNVLVIDLAESRLFVFENKDGRPSLLGDYYVSGGKNGAHKQRQGDRKTPVGVYFVVDRLPGEDLPDKYGPVAFPVDYPNEWDVRHGRTGGGIWLHGVSSDTYSRPPLDSDGCVALSNAELELVAPLLKAGSTPVLIGDGIAWRTADEMSRRQTAIVGSIGQWKADWESGETEAYLQHYSDDFLGRGMNKKRWDAYKTNVNRSKRFIRIGLGDMSVFAHPFESDMMVVSFDQQYESDTFSSSGPKRQYWRLEEDGRWRILSEENI